MVIVTKINKSFFLTLGLSLFFLSSCGFKVSSLGSRTGSIISGVISPFAGLIAQQDSPFNLISNAYSVNCADPVYVKLFKIENDGTISDASPLASQVLGADARYQFDLNGLNLSTTNSKVDYIVKAEGCNGNIFKRPVTSFDSKQDVDFNSNIVAEVVNANALISKKLNQVERNEVELLIKNLKGSNANTALDSLLNNQTNADTFAKIFGTNPAIIQNAMPEVSIDRPSSNLNELSTSTFQARATHVDPNYPFVYKWKLDNVLKTSSSTWNYNPSANESGSHQLTLQVGKNDGAGNIDLSKPYYSKTLTIDVNNNISTIAPDIAINASTPTPRNAPSIDVDLNTGAAFANCASFSHLAITETASVPTATQFNIDCTSAGTQTETVNFSSGDGSKTLYLWAIDEEGNISSPKSVNLILDTAPPVASITVSPVILKGGTTKSISLSASDAGVGMQDLKLYFASDAATYSLVSNLSVTASSYSWTFPTINTTNGKFKLVATDLVGSTTTVYSSLFEIDSVNPSSPSFSISSASPTSSSVVSTTMSACGADVSQILLTESNIQPTGVESGWQNCSTSAGAHSITISGNGVHNLYVWSKDAAGNIATSSTTQTITLDTTPPSISAGPSVATAMNKGGTSKTISWSVTDTTTATIALSYSLDNGSTYTSIATGLTNNGSYSWTVPTADSSQVLLKLVATDQLNFSSQATSSAYTIDSTAPTVAVTTPTGPLKGGSTITLNYSASDTNTISTLELAYAADGVTFGAPTSLTVGTTSSSWVVNSNDVTTAKLKIIATDVAGNVGTAITNAFTIDSTPPSAPTLARTSAAISGSATVTMTVGSCTATSQILITETNTSPLATAPGWQACSTGAGSTSATVSGQGNHTLYAWAKDDVGNVATTANSISMNYDSTNPSIGTAPGLANLVASGSSQSITWSATDANTLTIALEYYNGSAWVAIASGLTNSGSYSWSSVPALNITTAKIRLTATDPVGNTASAQSSDFTIDSTPPTISNFALNGSTSPGIISNNNLAVNFAAADNISTVTHYCMKYNTSTKPLSNDTCWEPISGLGLTPDNNISVLSAQNLYYRLGFGSGSYDVYLWVKDGADFVNATPGLINVTFQAPIPPDTSIITAANTDSASVPPVTTETSTPSGTPIFVKWKTTGNIASLALEISYNETDWTTIVSGINNGVNGSCTVTASFTGCLQILSSPSSSYFRVRLKAEGTDGSFSFSASNPLNTGGFRVIAGNTSETLGGAARSAVFIPSTNGDSRLGDATSMVVRNDGVIYLADVTRGLLKIDPSDGRLSVFIPNTGAITGDGGPVTSATVKLATKLTIDANNNLLLWDYNQIRLIDFSQSPPSISTIIGGGASTSDDVSIATNLSISVTSGKRRTFFPFPDGRLLFETESNGETSGTKRFRIWNPNDNSISSLNTAGDFTVGADNIRMGTCHKGSLAPIINSNVVTGYFIQYYQNGLSTCAPSMHRNYLTDLNLIPTARANAPHTEAIAASIVLGRDKKIYTFTKATTTGSSVARYNPSTNNWTPILGNGQNGYCADGTDILSCSMNLDDLFVASNGKYYFIDNNIIRTVSDDGKMLTLYGKSGNNTLGTGDSPLAIQSTGLSSFGIWTNAGNPTIVLFDNIAAKIVEFTFNSNLSHIAGNGLQATPSTSVDATATSITTIYGGTRSRTIGVNPSNGDVYAVPGAALYKLSRSTNRWSTYFGGGTSYDSANGLAASNITAAHAQSSGFGPLGISNGRMFVMHSKSTAGVVNTVMMKAYDLTTSVQEHILGSNLNIDTFCADGTSVTACPLPTSQNLVPEVHYDSTLNKYMMAYETKIRTVPTTGTGTISTLRDFGKNIVASTSYRNASNELVVLACATDGIIYKWNATTNIQSALPWPSTSITCQGPSLQYIPSRDAVIFIYSQNRLKGVAEYVNP